MTAIPGSDTFPQASSGTSEGFHDYSIPLPSSLMNCKLKQEPPEKHKSPEHKEETVQPLTTACCR